MDLPFKCVAVDLIGPITPASYKGHQYVLALMDYATRYLEAVPLKDINTETVTEALLDQYSPVEIPEEGLSDLGTQFVSERMQEVSRLLSIRWYQDCCRLLSIDQKADNNSLSSDLQ